MNGIEVGREEWNEIAGFWDLSEILLQARKKLHMLGWEERKRVDRPSDQPEQHF